MNKNLEIKLNFDVKTNKLSVATNELDRLSNTSKQLGSGIETIKDKIDITAHSLQAFSLGLDFLKGFSNALISPIKSALDLSSATEQLKLSLAALVNVSHQNVTATGKMLDSQQKWITSGVMAENAFKRINDINVKTIYTLDESASMFKTFYSTASATMNMNEALDAFEAIAFAAQTSGASADSLKMTLDSLGAGVVATTTDFGRFVSGQGLSTEAMKKAKEEGKLYEIILEKLGGFSNLAEHSAQTYGASLSNLNNIIDEIKKQSLAPFFEGIKQSINNANKALLDNKDSFIALSTAIGNAIGSLANALINLGGFVKNNSDTFLFFTKALFSVVGGIYAMRLAVMAKNVALGISHALNTTYTAGLGGMAIVTKGATIALNGLKLAIRTLIPGAGLFAILEVFTSLNNKSDKLKNSLLGISDSDIENKIKRQKEKILALQKEISNPNLEAYEYLDYKDIENLGLANKKKLSQEEKTLDILLQKQKELRKQQDEIKQESTTLIPKISNKETLTPIIKDLNALNSALNDIASIGLSEYEKGMLSIKAKYDSWIKAGVSEIEAKDAVIKLRDELDNSHNRQSYKTQMESELGLQRQKIALISDENIRAIEEEKLRHEEAIVNLNLELELKIKLGILSQEQIQAEYNAELKTHNAKMELLNKQEQAQNKYLENIKQNMSGAFESVIFDSLSGKFKGFGDLFTDLFSSIQESITKGFAKSIADAFMQSSVMESMQGVFADALSSFSGDSSASGGNVSSMLENTDKKGLLVKGGEILGGFGVGSAAGGLIGSFLSDKENAKKTNAYSMSGAAAGAVIGSFIPVVGSILGGVIGGTLGALVSSFSSSKTSMQGKGVQLWQDASFTSGVNASEYADYEKTKSSWWGLSKKTSYWTEYYGANSQALKNIRTTLLSYEHFLQDLGGGIKSISVSSGRYSSYVDIINAGVKDFIAEFLGIEKNLELNVVYGAWESYANSVSKNVNEIFGEVMNKYIEAGNNFNSWLYKFRGDELGGANFAKNLAQQNINRISEALGLKDGEVSVDNFLSWRENAIKSAFDPNTIELINALGEALMNSANASKEYEEALNAEINTKLNLIDPFLNKTKNLENTNIEGIDTKERVSLEMLSVLKKLLNLQQEALA